MDTDYQNDSSTLQISFQSDDMNEQSATMYLHEF